MTDPTWRERIAAALMDHEYGTRTNAWRPDPHIEMVRADPDYILCKKPLAAADALIASGVLGSNPGAQTPVPEDRTSDEGEEQ